MLKEDSKKGFYITTAIAYPNSKIHLGFAWEALACDMIARFQRMQQRPVFFCTGTDEHSQNVEKAASRQGRSPKDYCDEMARDIQNVMEKMDVAFDRFIRTSDEDHQAVCQHLIQKAHDVGDVYCKEYEGLYCDGCEAFYTEKEAVESAGKPSCPTHQSPLRLLSEENYFFKLSRYEERLKQYFEANASFLCPESRRNEVLSFIEQGLKDFSVSRTSFQWGIKLPFDQRHIIYVWYDALINYLTAVGYLKDQQLFELFWPCDIHVIGKDITRFHTVYWPAMLWSAGLELPKKIFAHGFLQLNGEKMSKTRGNIVTPEAVIQDYGTEALRWYLLAANAFYGDGNYSDQELILKYNADLANTIGNLLNRVVNMTRKFFDGGSVSDQQMLPESVTSLEDEWKKRFSVDASSLKDAIEQMDPSAYCQIIVDFAVDMNKFIDVTKPWALAKKEENKKYLETVLYELLEGLRCLSIAFWPVLPQSAAKMWAQLGLQTEVDWVEQKLHQSGRVIHVPEWREFKFKRKGSFTVQEPVPVFPRIEPLS